MISNIITKGINGTPKIPGDKSISHRSIILPSISNGVCEISNILKSDDVLHTLNAFKAMGVNIIENEGKIIIQGKGLNSLRESKNQIYHQFVYLLNQQFLGFLFAFLLGEYVVNHHLIPNRLVLSHRHLL